jgi:hypothetical protein
MNMKTNTITKARVDGQLLHEIRQEVKETLALGMELNPKKNSTFCVADLWNIHRNKKQRTLRRFL